MKFFYLASLALLAGLVSATPTRPTGIAITGITYSGSGCPNRSVGSFLSTNGSVYTLIFDKFLVSVAAGAAATYTADCNVTLAIKYTDDFTFAILCEEYRGFVGLHPNVTASLSTSFYFGTPFPLAAFETTFMGPMDQDYQEDANVTLSAQNLSPSGGTTTLNVISTLSISNIANPDGSGQITEDSQDGELTI